MADENENETDRRRLIKLNACTAQTTGGYIATADESVNSSIVFGLSSGVLLLSAALFWKGNHSKLNRFNQFYLIRISKKECINNENKYYSII